VRDVQPASPPPVVVPSGPDVSSFIQSATAAAAACRYPEAVSHADRAAAAAPGHPWVVANHETLRHLAERQRIAVEAMNAGNQAARAKDFAAAGRYADTVQKQAPRCMDSMVSGWMDAINRSARAAQAEAQQGGGGQQAAGTLLPGLIDVLNKAIEGQNQPRTTPPSGGSTGAGTSTAKTADPCESKATYLNKWNPTPRCDCDGYKWNGYKCVPGAGGGGKTAGPTQPAQPAPTCVSEQYRLIDPPPYSGVSPVCTGSTGGTWLVVANNMHKVISIQKGSYNKDTRCYDGSTVVTDSRQYGGRLCPPKR